MKKNQFEAITKWQRETFKNSTAISKVYHLEKEVQELKEALKNFHRAEFDDRVFMGEFNRICENVRIELADCIILLYGAAGSFEMDYNDICKSIQRKFEEVKTRKWGEPDENGVVEHIKQS